MLFANLSFIKLVSTFIIYQLTIQQIKS